MTTVYFVRHGQADNTVHDNMKRPLTEKGMKDRELVSQFLEGKGVSVIVSSPYKRAYDTVADFAHRKKLDIIPADGFRERKIGDGWIEDFMAYAKQQWSDFDYKLLNGESLRAVQARNIEALFGVLDDYPNETIVIGSHGTALSTIVNYFDRSFGFENFLEIIDLTPWIVHLQFQGRDCISINSINLFKL